MPANSDSNSRQVPASQASLALQQLFVECGGCSFGKGIYKIHSPKSSAKWRDIIEEYFPAYTGKITPFGFDWMGRQFCLVDGRDEPIFMFDCSTHEDFYVQQDLEKFHNYDLTEDREDTLSESTFERILKLLGQKEVQYNDCLGYKIPLFLGGKDDISNYENIDMDVYWTITCQLFDQVKDLPDGTPINKIEIKKP